MPWVAIAVSVAGMAWAAEAQPWLPTFSLEDFPREVRQQVQQAYEFASTHPNDAEAVGKLAMLLDLYHRPQDSVRCYERARQLSPRTFKWLYYEGILRLHEKERAEAASLFRQALQIDPSYLPARLKYASSLLDSGSVEESDKEYHAILHDYPDAAEAYYGLGQISSLRGDLPAAVKQFQRAVELFPPYGPAHYALARAARIQGDPAEAAAQLRIYEADQFLIPPIDDPLRDAMRAANLSAAAHLEWGLELQSAGRLEDAIAETEKAAALDPQLVLAQVNLIILYGQQGDFAKGEEHYKRAIALSPDRFPKAYYNYGVLLMKAGRLTEAATAFQKAIAIAPDYADPHNNLGYLLEREGNLDAAADEYRKAITARPEFRQAHFNLGRILLNQHDLNAAIDQFLKTLTPVDAETPSYLYALGAAYGRAGNKQQALEYLQQARNQANSFGQKDLLREIDQDLSKLSAARTP